MDSEEVEACIQRMNDLDAKVVSHIYRHCNNLMEFKAIQSDKRSRYNRAQLLSKESKRGASSFRYIVGEMVSYGGWKVTLDSLERLNRLTQRILLRDGSLIAMVALCMFAWTLCAPCQLMLQRS